MALFALSVSAAALGSVLGVPGRLTDGSVAPVVPEALKAQRQAFVMTKVRVTRVRQTRRLVASCARGERVSATAEVIQRIGVNGRTITFTDAHGGIMGCDRSLRARTIFAPWCGGSAWLLRRWHVSDPRLDVCTDRQKRPVIAFGWINPVPRVRWIVVDQPGYREVYPIVGVLPVRVSTISGLGRVGGAVFHTAQYDANGVLLVRRKVVASIAS